jgi:indole-3-glycerol phosphate synthase
LFQGNLNDVFIAKGVATHAPIIRRDIIIHPMQIHESASLKVNALTLTAAVLTIEEMVEFQELAMDYGIEVLVEVFDADDIHKCIDAGVDTYLINNNDFSGIDSGIQNTKDLIALIPGSSLVVASDGISSFSDIEALNCLGVNGAVIGESFLDVKKNPSMIDLSSKISELSGSQILC